MLQATTAERQDTIMMILALEPMSPLETLYRMDWEQLLSTLDQAQDAKDIMSRELLS